MMDCEGGKIDGKVNDVDYGLDRSTHINTGLNGLQNDKRSIKPINEKTLTHNYLKKETLRKFTFCRFCVAPLFIMAVSILLSHHRREIANHI